MLCRVLVSLPAVERIEAPPAPEGAMINLSSRGRRTGDGMCPRSRAAALHKHGAAAAVWVSADKTRGAGSKVK